MSQSSPNDLAHRFAALGDRTRLSLVAKLAETGSLSIAELTDGMKLTRQGVTKHLRVLENAGLVRSIRRGRETRFDFDPAAMRTLEQYLASVSAQWDQALQKLKAFVEDPPS